MSKHRKRLRKKRNLSSVIITLILVILISFSAVSTVLASEQYSNGPSYFNIESLISKLRAKFGSDDILKLKINLEMARENLNSLRKINVDKITDEKLVLEMLDKTDESFTNNASLINVVKNKFKKDPGTISAAQLINLLINFRDISTTSQDLLNQIKPAFKSSNISSKIDNLLKKAYRGETAFQQDIDDLSQNLSL